MVLARLAQAEQYRQAGKAFFEVIEKYQPEYVIVWARGFGIIYLVVTGAKSKFLMFTGWIAMTSKWKALLVPNGASYMMPGGKHVKALVVNHPSVGYSWDYWYKVIQRFLR